MTIGFAPVVRRNSFSMFAFQAMTRPQLWVNQYESFNIIVAIGDLKYR